MFVKEYNGDPIPFREFYEWTQCRIDMPSPTCGHKQEPILPLIGGLTGFLIIADLTYMGKVKGPDPTEMGGLVFDLGLGTKKGLQVANLVSGPKPTREQVVASFVHTHDFLHAELTEDERCSIRFDSVMLEHTLCKYQRLMREMSRRGFLIDQQI